MKKFLIIRTGGTFSEYAEENGDFEHWTAQGMGLANDQWQCVNVQAGETLPDPAGFAGAVITGSHDMVTDDLPWINDTKAWVVKAVQGGLPVLGICFGHQLMADALGGRADYHPDGREIGTAKITLTAEGGDDPLLGSLGPSFTGHVTHSQTVLELPPDATLVATGTHDPHQCFRVGRGAWGVQFHPEFDAEAVRYYIGVLSDKLAEEGQDVEAVRATVTDTPESAGVLKRFVAYCRGR